MKNFFVNIYSINEEKEIRETRKIQNHNFQKYKKSVCDLESKFIKIKYDFI